MNTNATRFKISFENADAFNCWIDHTQYELGLEIGNGFDMNQLNKVIEKAKEVSEYYNDKIIVRIFNIDKDGDIDLDDLVEQYTV